MKTARQSDAVSWWMMGRNAKARGMDYLKLAEDLKNPAAKQLFLDGAEGRSRPKPNKTAQRTVSP